MPDPGPTSPWMDDGDPVGRRSRPHITDSKGCHQPSRSGFRFDWTPANPETCLRENTSAGGLFELLCPPSDGVVEIMTGASSGDEISPSGEKRATNLPQSQSSTSCPSTSSLAARKAASSWG